LWPISLIFVCTLVPRFFIQAASSAGFNRPLACNAASRHRAGDDHQGYLLDTNTASYIIKGTISFRSAAVGEVPMAQLAISTVSEGLS
jgi:hypothetical protein